MRVGSSNIFPPAQCPKRYVFCALSVGSPSKGITRPPPPPVELGTFLSATIRTLAFAAEDGFRGSDRRLTGLNLNLDQYLK